LAYSHPYIFKKTTEKTQQNRDKKIHQEHLKPKINWQNASQYATHFAFYIAITTFSNALDYPIE